MKLKLLLDEHIDPEVARALRRRFPELDVSSIQDTPWVGLPDPALLELLDAERCTLVTRDVNSVPWHANQRLQAGLTHGGVIKRRRRARAGRLDLPQRLALSDQKGSRFSLSAFPARPRLLMSIGYSYPNNLNLSDSLG